MDQSTTLIISLAVAIVLILAITVLIKNRKLNQASKELITLKVEIKELVEKVDHLSQYEIIDDAKKEAENIIAKANKLLSEAQGSANEELTNAKAKSKELKENADRMLSQANELALKIENEAQERAKEIAASAWEAKSNAEHYEATAKAMKNAVKGYGDEYLVPNESLLDELAEEYSHETAGEDLKKVRAEIKAVVKDGAAADCDYSEPNRRTTAIEFVLDAYLGKIDSIMARVKHDNYGKLNQQLEDAYRLVNHNGMAFRNARINQRFHQLHIEQLKSAVTVQELKRRDLEEQRRIREEMRDEEKARREYEKAIKQAEREEKVIQKALKEAREKLESAAAEDRAKLETQLEELTYKLKEAEEKGTRALSMAQQTKQGHVYIISNIGSFGDEVFKIGLTRRLDPVDRVKELGDASVPFPFDIHAMIHSDDAPRLERELHTLFVENQLNKVNPRKEFFKIPLKDIKDHVQDRGLKAHWTMKAEALEFRESMQLQRKAELASAAL